MMFAQETRGLEHHFEGMMYVPPHGETHFAFSPKAPARLARLIATVLQAGPAQRCRTWRGMNIPGAVAVRTQSKRIRAVWFGAHVTSLRHRNIELLALYDAIPLVIFAPNAFPIEINTPTIRSDDSLTIDVRSRVELGFWLAMRCVFRVLP